MKQGRFGVRSTVVLLGAAVVLAFPASALAAPNDTNLVSRADGAGGDKQNGTFVDGPAISADGRYVAFSANADNLDGGVGPERVFLRDTVDDTVELVSRADGAPLVNPNSAATSPAVSADGRFVAFESTANNLNALDTDAGTTPRKRTSSSAIGRRTRRSWRAAPPTETRATRDRPIPPSPRTASSSPSRRTPPI